MPVPKAITGLTSRFLEQFESYSGPKYNETQARREFVDPFFKALGWDIDNSQSFSEAYKDVVHEDAIKIQGDRGAPDYSFRVGGVRKFFLEAKKPALTLKEDSRAAYQIRRYGWSAKLPVSVLTNFKELAVYDCRVRPHKTDNAAVARLLYATYDQYHERWEEIASIFSKDALYKGTFDRFIESSKLKKGTSQVDDDFLTEIESWRDSLARTLALRNSKLSQEELNYAVQTTIDRIIFLRICEDRGIEPYGQLHTIASRDDTYTELVALFRSADDRYNSGLFHFRAEKGRLESPDLLTPRLLVDDRLIKEIISGLYYPDSPYEFSVISGDILGQVYEQFLGKVIRLTPSHRAVVDEKPEVKKAGGVYYTPTSIVNYIVSQTVGSWLEGKSVKQAATLTILDPACGSGSFLISAYQHLLDWYLDQYKTKSKAQKGSTRVDVNGQVRLTSAERKRILLSHIFGVDVDQQAVEVTKLSLLLKVLEGESAETIRDQLELFRVRALPDLASNIRLGNSLIGSDFYAYEQFDLLDARQQTTRTFDWDDEFPTVMKRDGFDVVLGNPPYVNAWTMYEATPEIRDYFNSSQEYLSADRHWDMYVLFLERSLKLLRPSGRLSFIIPYSYCIQKYAAISRQMILDVNTLESIVDLRTVRAFHNVPVITIIPVICKKAPSSGHKVQILGPGEGASSRDPGKIRASHKIAQKVFRESENSMWRLDLDQVSLATAEAIEKLSITLGDISFVNYGAQMSSKKKSAFGKDHVLRDRKATKTSKRTISGRNLYRYRTRWDGQYVEWALAPKMYGPRARWFFETPKLMVRDITGTHRLELSLDREKLYCDHTVLCCLRACDLVHVRDSDIETVELSRRYSLELLLGLIASRPVSAYYYWRLSGEGVRTGGGFHTYPNTIRSLPLLKLDVGSKTQRSHIRKIESYVKRMLLLRARANKEKNESRAKELERQFEALDRRVDLEVYQLYGFDDKQIQAIIDATP